MSDEQREQGRDAHAPADAPHTEQYPATSADAAAAAPTPGPAGSDPAEHGVPVGDASRYGAGDQNHGRSNQGAPDQGAPDNSPPNQGAPDHGPQGYGAPNQGAPNQGAPNQGAPNHGAPDHGAPGHGPQDRGTPGYGPYGYGVPPRGDPGYGNPAHGTATPGPATSAQRRPRRVMTGIVGAALIAGLVGGGAGFGGAYLLLGDGSGPRSLTTSPSTPAVSTTPGTVAGAAAVATPSTVDIRVTTAQGAAEGSGVVLTEDGAVLTNNHVVGAAGGGEITVTFTDGTEHPATVVGRAPSYDLAVLQVQDVSGLTPATFGNSADLQVGQQVVAIGSPRGLTGTVTTGIVSAFDRTVTVQGEDGQAVVYNGMQTDAPINQGNSGGPLVDLQGRVVGINSAIATTGESTGSIGLGFAIPVDQAKRVSQEILDTGTATKPVLGVQGDPTAGDGSGAQVGAVTEGSAAADAGLAAGDVVTRVDDAQVQNFVDLIARVGAQTPGDTVTLTVSSGGAERTVEVTLGSTPDAAATTTGGGESGQQAPFGGGNPFGSPFGN